MDVSDLELLCSLVEMGSVQPVLGSVFSLERAREAFDQTGLERSLGKAVITWTTPAAAGKK